MKYKTSQLKGALLDTAVAKTQCWELKHTMDYAPNVDGWGRDIPGAGSGRIESGWKKWHSATGGVISLLGYGNIKECDWKPSSDWGLGGPIIEREEIELWKWKGHDGTYWCAHVGGRRVDTGDKESIGETPLVAAMRAFVHARCGAEVDL